MDTRRLLLAFLLVDMVVFTGWVLVHLGPSGVADAGAALVASPAMLQVGVDLAIALGLGCAWMVADARKHGRSALPFVLATPLVGSIALLAYLVLRPAPSRATAHAL